MLSTIPDYQLADIVSSIVTSSRKEKIDVLNATDLEVNKLFLSHSIKHELSILIFLLFIRIVFVLRYLYLRDNFVVSNALTLNSQKTTSAGKISG
jgi:hypothetical protein